MTGLALTLGPGRHAEGEPAFRPARRRFVAGARRDMQELAAELGVDWDRIATMLPPTAPAIAMPEPDPASVFYKTLTSTFSDPTIADTPAWRRAEVGATTATATPGR